MRQALKRLLIVSTRPEAVRASTLFLERRDFKVTTCQSLQDALLSIKHSDFDSVFLSIQLPSRPLEAFRKLLATVADLPVILFSDINSMEAVQRLGSFSEAKVLYPPMGGPAIERALLQCQSGGHEPALEVYWPYGAESRNHSAKYNFLLKALDRSTGKIKSRKSIGIISRVSVLEVHSRSMRGYLVAARADGKMLDPEILEKVYDQLARILRSSGEQLECPIVRSVDVDPVDFMEWSRAKAEVSRVAEIEGEEFAIAFFSTRSESLFKEGFVNDHMVAIDVSQVPGSVPCDLYLYLPLNRKFIVYVRKGKALPQECRQKLKSRRVERLFARRIDLDRVKVTMARQFLDASISAFRGEPLFAAALP
jgi:CheY-like chemotaxis protein